MSDTTNLGLPLLSPNQAQKHVTVNEAFARLDGLTQLVLASRSLTTPPVAGTDGAAYGVPSGGVNAWAGQDGNVAIFSNGGWVFAVPKRGWRGFVLDESAMVTHDGTDWQAGVAALSPNGAATLLKIDEFDHDVAAGATSTTTQKIANGVMVLAVTARVLEDITGTATSWQLGTAGAPDRFGTGLGLPAGSYARGMLSAPMTYWGAAVLILTAQGGSFAGGKVRLAIHYLDLGLPAA